MFDWIERGSYLGIILFLTLTGIGLPIPEEVPIVAAGLASKAAALKWYYALPAEVPRSWGTTARLYRTPMTPEQIKV
jgi:membrane protein DedA with SNARE-associated domain